MKTQKERSSVFNLFVLMLLTGALFTACKSASKEVEVSPAPVISLEQKIENWTDSAMASGVRKDTVVLDFKFGMSKNDVRKHTLRMHSRKKMYKVKKRENVWEYVYDLRLAEIGKVRTYFDAFYHENKLYKIECLPRVPNGADVTEVLDGTRELFTLKYGDPHFELPSDSLAETGPTYLWIEGNRRIELGQSSDETVVINYIDLVGEQQAIRALDI